ncbi:MAG: prolyl oligopeptidase family serine peptidase [Acidiphilium sp.]|nr:prolyl oligopeptidase family serine peptidase [Acidiphilium sp.]MDD4935457.1 prolyl oligopeptidase family serine peptidase [Acidiphilium sp.]
MNEFARSDDPYLWLEEIEGERALEWVEAQNRASCARLCDDRFAADRAVLTAQFNSDARIPAIVQRGEFVYNFWTDAAHQRGVWRRTTLAAYRGVAPDWDMLLDLDALCVSQGESWVWHGAQTLAPDHARALISLSPGGSDAGVVREFDIATRRFVGDGFVVPIAKTSVSWVDADTVLLASAYGGDVTASGYARTVRQWRRGTAIEAAPVVFEVEASDMAASASCSHDPAYRFIWFSRTIAFYRNQYFYQALGGSRVRLDLPEDADVDIGHGRLLVRPRSAFAVSGVVYAPGSLVAIGVDDFIAGSQAFAPVFTPTPKRALESWINLKSGLVLTVLDNVASVIEFADAAAGWAVRPVPGLSANSAISVRQLAPDDYESDALLFTVSGFLTPDSLMLGTPNVAPEVIKQLPAQFDAAGLMVRQYEAIAADGTAIPYFMVAPEAPPRDGGFPTYLYGYGGFEISLTPYYLATQGALWCAKGGAFVLANIRGGGEFGPEWHKAGVREGKKIAQDDFAAVAADLVTRGLSTPARILGSGGSNGGLLVGNMLTRHPDLFGAIICAVPLLDMRRYTKLLAGHSWIAEYGDPDVAEDWAFLQEISAYQLVRQEQHYPPVFINTTRRDDRVHPGHARKMAAKLQNFGYDALYYEQAEGGHGAGADAAQRAFFYALGFAFARQTVGI